jgi:hypothetical protein
MTMMLNYKFKKRLLLVFIVLVTSLLLLFEEKEKTTFELKTLNGKIEKKDYSNVEKSFKWLFNNNIFQYSVYLIRNGTESHLESNYLK